MIFSYLTVNVRDNEEDVLVTSWVVKKQKQKQRRHKHVSHHHQYISFLWIRSGSQWLAQEQDTSVFFREFSSMWKLYKTWFQMSAHSQRTRPCKSLHGQFVYWVCSCRSLWVIQRFASFSVSFNSQETLAFFMPRPTKGALFLENLLMKIPLCLPPFPQFFPFSEVMEDIFCFLCILHNAIYRQGILWLSR